MKKYFVVSDVHSFYKQLQDALNLNEFDIDNPDHILVLCGDLFDRGPDTLQLYEFVKSLDSRFIYIRGNHEDLLFSLVDSLAKDEYISDAHYSNGTIRTVAAFCNISEREFAWPNHSLREVAVKSMRPVLDFIASKIVDYFELSNFVFVHGWIPYKTGPKYEYQLLDDWRNATAKQWAEARWANGMELAHYGIILSDKTIVCGHWNCSFGWSYYKQDREEFPNKSKKDWQKSFEPYKDKGIIAIDACTAYSGICNCIVIEE